MESKDINVFAQGEDLTPGLEHRPVPHQSDYPEKFFNQRNIDGYVISSGALADRPDGSTHIKSYFAEDTNKLYIWDEVSNSWVTVNEDVTTTLTTKGDIQGFDTAEARVPVGTNGQVLVADSTDAQGLSWINFSVNQNLPVTADPTTTNTSYEDMPDETGVSSLENSHVAKTGRVIVLLKARLYNNTASQSVSMAIQKDADSEVGDISMINNANTAATGFPACTFYLFTGLTIGTTYVFTGRWKVSGGTATLQASERAIVSFDV